MPIRPKPMTYVCQSCGWKKTVAPMSDVLVPGNIVKQCVAARSKDHCARSTVTSVFRFNFQAGVAI